MRGDAGLGGGTQADEIAIPNATRSFPVHLRSTVASVLNAYHATHAPSDLRCLDAHTLVPSFLRPHERTHARRRCTPLLQGRDERRKRQEPAFRHQANTPEQCLPLLPGANMDVAPELCRFELTQGADQRKETQTPSQNLLYAPASCPLSVTTHGLCKGPSRRSVCLRPSVEAQGWIPMAPTMAKEDGHDTQATSPWGVRRCLEARVPLQNCAAFCAQRTTLQALDRVWAS